MLNCIIVDDEVLALDLLEDYIRNVPFLNLIERCVNPVQAIDALQRNSIDLVFSDIQMQGIDGMQLIRTLSERPMFVMVTAFNSYAIEGYELDVVDYLLKPVSFERFLKSCNKALKQFNAHHKNKQPEYVFFHADYSLIKVILDEVLYIEAVKDFVKIHYSYAGKKALLVRHSMKGIEEIFPSVRFIRIHKSYIVNTNFVTAIRKNSLFLSELELPVSEQYKEAIVLLANRKI